MALLSRGRQPVARTLTLLFVAVYGAVVGSSCTLVDPLIASKNYTVQDEGEGKAKIEVELVGGAEVSRLRQRDLILDYMIDMSRDPSRDSAAFDAMLELENLFEQQGYPTVEIDYKVDRSQGTKVTFTIQPHNQVILRECKIVGGPIPAEELQKFRPVRLSGNLGFGDELYVAADIETLRRNIIQDYLRRGYLDIDVVVTGPTPAITTETKEVRIQLEVIPKRRYVLDTLNVDPEIAEWIARYQAMHDRDPSRGPAPPKPPETGAPFADRIAEDYALDLNAFLRRWGHPRPLLSAETTPDRSEGPSGGRVAVRITGDPGKPRTIERVEIAGNDFVTEANVRQRISLEPGQRFDGQLEEQSLLRLYRSGLFRSAEAVYQDIGDDRVVVTFRLQESTRYLVQPLIGYGSYEELRGGIEFEMLSFLDSDFDLRSKVVLSRRGYRTVASLTDSEFWPALLGSDTALSISLDAFEREEPEFTDGAIGLSPSLSHIFTPQLSARIGYVIRDHGAAESDVIDPGAAIGAYREGSMVFEVAYDSRDNPIMPKKLGSRIAFQHKWADETFGSEVEFHRTRLTAVTILPVTDSTRFVVRAEAGLLFATNGFDTVPIQERFFNGGEITVRSYREDELARAGLRDINNRVIGGGYRNVFNAELRWNPGIRVLDTLDLELAAFVDAGNLGRLARDYDTDSMRYSVGAGLRILLPIGPVRFDYGYNPDPEDGDRRSNLHFSIGYAF